MKTATAPGISHGSIILCQDWGRLLCQSNAADPHHEHPPAYTASFLPAQCVCEQVCGFLNSIPQQPVLYGITLDFSYSVLFFLIVDELLAHTLSYIINPPPQVLYPLLPRPNTHSQVTLSSYHMRSFFYISSSVQIPPPHLCCHVLLKRSTMWDVLLVVLISKLHLLVHLWKLLKINSKTCNHSFVHFF